jgi:glyoxalase family protein
MPPILGLHHVTATVDDAQADLDFVIEHLGLRLVKKTVNFDNHHVYHFYYGTERGVPGTIWTTFPYRGRGVRIGTIGAGQVVATAFSAPAGAEDYWRGRLTTAGLDVRDRGSRFGVAVLGVTDPSGLQMEVIATGRDDRAAWANGGVGADSAIRGLHSVTLCVRNREPTIALMTGVLGYHVAAEEGTRTRLTVNGDLPGRTIDVVETPDAPAGVNGLGTVHHVAMAIDTDEQQLQLREELLNMGLNVTPVRDRTYFHSIYFREPGGVLFEVATMRPGFEFDEPLGALGRGLKLPPWEEPERAAIEAGLEPVRYRS